MSNKVAKTSQKILALTIVLPTVLRGFIPALRRGFRYLTLGLRMLKGQAHSYNECVRLNVEPGSSCFDKKLIPIIKTYILEGLAMSQGAMPPSVLKPSLHAVGHYPDKATRYGILLW